MVVGRGCRNKFRDGVGDGNGVLDGVTCRGGSKSEFKEKGVDYQIQRSLSFPRSIRPHRQLVDTVKITGRVSSLCGILA